MRCVALGLLLVAAAALAVSTVQAGTLSHPIAAQPAATLVAHHGHHGGAYGHHGYYSRGYPSHHGYSHHPGYTYPYSHRGFYPPVIVRPPLYPYGYPYGSGCYGYGVGPHGGFDYRGSGFGFSIGF